MKKLVHLSDLHFRQNWEEDQGIVLDAFFKDLHKQLIQSDISDVYIAFSGDVVLAGGKPELYNSFLKQFDTELNKLKLVKAQRICIPGNHDVSVDFIKEKNIEHEGVMSQKLNEKDFNDYVQKQPSILADKFINYRDFEATFASYGIRDLILSGSGFDLEEDIGIYCLNTAACSSGGLNTINDKGRLAIDTRSLHKWLTQNKTKSKVLIMHHPIDWLTEWAQVELKKILRNSFSLCLSGHIHEQDFFHSINKEDHLIQCSAPPLLTNKSGRLGYSIISISDKGVGDITYRQWTKNNSFVTGVDFSNTDNGKVIIQIESIPNSSDNVISHLLKARLDIALRSFSSQPLIWVNPVVSKTNKISANTYENLKNAINLNTLISHPYSTFIKAPPQFGLTCLAQYLIKQAWEINKDIWLYLDFNSIKSHAVDKSIQKELEYLGVKLDIVKCIIVDSWSTFEKDSYKILKFLIENYKTLPIIIMQTIDDSKFNLGSELKELNRNFEVLHLLSLPRGHVRKVVADYNSLKQIGDEDTITSKVIGDMEVLNIHRTPLNCLTLLKVSEIYFDDSPVNRTKMLEMVLFILFNIENIPTYKAKPDLKDCEYVLGRYCEKLIKTTTSQFSREDFLKELKSYCAEKLIELDIDVVFDVLYANNIIIKRENQYGFRFTYWIYYFVAQRMHQDQGFANYIFEDKRYVSYPEIIEFYTGIDRRREDALKILTKDIKEIRESVKSKVGLPEQMNPYRSITWNPSEESLEKIQNEIAENVLNSKLPDEVKDQYADRSYNQIRPYDQNIKSFFQNYSLNSLSQALKATSRALRNSDYVDPVVKRELLQEILQSWEQYSMVLIAITPILSDKGQARYDDINFSLSGNFGDTVEKRTTSVLDSIPYNIIKWYKDDLFSNKMGPLLFDQLANETNEIRKHELAILIVIERPKNWKTNIQNYIASISKNSFYLHNLITLLIDQYKFSYASPATLKEIEFLIKMGFAKHQFGDKKPGLDKIVKIPNKVLPKREADNDEM